MEITIKPPSMTSKDIIDPSSDDNHGDASKPVVVKSMNSDGIQETSTKIAILSWSSGDVKIEYQIFGYNILCG